MPNSTQDLDFQDTLVGFFDIHGYSAFIDDQSVTFEEKIKLMKRFKANHLSISNTDMYGVKLHSWVMSDSLVIAIDTQRSPLFAGSVNVLLMTCAFILEESMRQKFPLRGAIGAGRFYMANDLLLSDALIDAVKYEKEQDWFGALISPNAETLIERKIPGYFSSTTNTYLENVSKGPVPFKNGNAQEFRYLQPTNCRPDWETACIPHYFNQNESTKQKIVNSRVLYNSAT